MQECSTKYYKYHETAFQNKRSQYTMIKSVKRESLQNGRVIASYSSNNGLISKICKEKILIPGLPNQKTDKTTKQIQMVYKYTFKKFNITVNQEHADQVHIGMLCP